MREPAWVSFGALGSTAVVAAADGDRLDAARGEVERVLAAFDEACSRFRDDSEVERLNRSRGEPMAVSPLLLDAMSAAVRAAELTDGDVDPTVGEALIALGYDRDFKELADRPAVRRPVRIASVPGWRTIHVDRAAGTVRLGRGVTVDLGATAKALAADRAALSASEAAGCGVLVSLGGDIAVVGAGPSDGWRIRVTDDHRSATSAPGQWITVQGGGLATSSTTVRQWENDDGSAHHLVDPRTGRSSDSVWRTVSVTAASCLDANIASTAAIIRGQSAVPWLRSLRLPSRLVDVNGTVCHLAGWPSEGDDLPSVEGVAA
jgi:FAD:protein FMN transferase